jgi:hypothetical protein
MARVPSGPEEREIAYADARDRVRDGDLFLFRGEFLISKLFRRVDHSFYSHAALAAWWGDRLMILQAEGTGIQAIPMSVAIGTYPGRADWYTLKREEIPEFDAKLRGVLREARSDLGLAYGYVDLLRNIARWAVRVRLADPSRPRAMFCSEYVERCFREAGMSLTSRPDIVTFPKHIAASKLASYVGSIPHDPKLLDSRDDDAVAS